MNTIASNPVSAAVNEKRSELVRHVGASWGFLVPRHGPVTLKAFAAEIRNYSSDARAAAIAAELETYEGTIWRDWKGVHIKWQ